MFLCLLAWTKEIDWKVTSNQVVLKALDREWNENPTTPMDKQLVEEPRRKCLREGQEQW